MLEMLDFSLLIGRTRLGEFCDWPRDREIYIKTGILPVKIEEVCHPHWPWWSLESIFWAQRLTNIISKDVDKFHCRVIFKNVKANPYKNTNPNTKYLLNDIVNKK